MITDILTIDQLSAAASTIGFCISTDTARHRFDVEGDGMSGHLTVNSETSYAEIDLDADRWGRPDGDEGHSAIVSAESWTWLTLTPGDHPGSKHLDALQGLIGRLSLRLVEYL